MKRGVLWLRISYWTGAVIDGLAALQLLLPNVFAATNRLSGFHPSMEYTYAAGMGASLMLGWTALLLWANCKPMERKDVLVMTIVPVVLGLVVTEIWAVVSGFLALGTLTPIWLLQIGLIALFAFSYLHARRMERFSC